MGIEMIGKYRPENTQSSNTEPGACLRQRLGIDRHFIRHRTILSEPQNYDQSIQHADCRGGRRPEHCWPRRRGLPHRAQVAVAAGEVLPGLGLLEPGPERGRSQQCSLLVVVLHDDYTAGAQ